MTDDKVPDKPPEFKQCLFIGGVADGHWIDVFDNQRIVLIPIPPPALTPLASPKPIKLPFDTYERETVENGDQRFYLFRIAHITTAEMFFHLLRGYRRP